MKILALGDMHSIFSDAYRIAEKESPDIILQVGDFYEIHNLTSESMLFIDKWASKTYSIYGNHDTYDNMIGTRLGLFQSLGGLNIACLHGVYSSKWRNNRKYWKVNDLIQLSNLRDIDIFMTHETFYGMNIIKRGKDVGNPILTKVVDYMQPRFVVSGHHHTFKLRFYNNTIAISLPPPNKGYAVLLFEGREIKNFWTVLRDNKREIIL